ncbi:MAG: EF-hand domain-containing protein [Opitutales bacterium]|nr:EF-hand domain-containing protein [Opitutales bacterium]
MKLKNISIMACALSFCAVLSFAQSAPEAADSAPAAAAESAAADAQKGKLPEAFKKRILRQFDKDGDGYLNETELAAAKASLKERRQRFEEMQKKHAQKMIEEFDKDGDGKLSAEELVPLIEKQRRMFADMSARSQNRRAEGRAEGRGEGRGERGERFRRDRGEKPDLPPPPQARQDGATPPPPPPDVQRRGPRQLPNMLRHPSPEDLDELAKPEAK